MEKGAKVEGMHYAGGLRFEMRSGGEIYSANITPDPETGIGQLDRSAVRRSLQERRQRSRGVAGAERQEEHRDAVARLRRHDDGRPVGNLRVSADADARASCRAALSSVAQFGPPRRNRGGTCPWGRVRDAVLARRLLAANRPVGGGRGGGVTGISRSSLSPPLAVCARADGRCRDVDDVEFVGEGFDDDAGRRSRLPAIRRSRSAGARRVRGGARADRRPSESVATSILAAWSLLPSSAAAAARAVRPG